MLQITVSVAAIELFDNTNSTDAPAANAAAFMVMAPQALFSVTPCDLEIV